MMFLFFILSSLLFWHNVFCNANPFTQVAYIPEEIFLNCQLNHVSFNCEGWIQDYNIYLSSGGEYFNPGLDDYFYRLCNNIDTTSRH